MISNDYDVVGISQHGKAGAPVFQHVSEWRHTRY